MKHIIIILTLIALVGPINTQIGQPCISKNEITKLASKHDPLAKEKLCDLDEHWKVAQENDPSTASMKSAIIQELSVVFHIVSSSGSGISDARVKDALDNLNASFRNRGYYDPNTGVDTEIQFCLAQRDPSGQPTTGINRLNSPLAKMILEYDDQQLKSLIQWDPFCYINLWIVEEISSISAGNGVSGYAFFPTSHGSALDGIVIEADFTGNDPTKGTVLTHEVGHYLGLYHTFEGGCKNDDCLRDGDKICDTPPDQSTGYIDCNTAINSCSTDPISGFNSDQNDMISNYMDYSRQTCYDQFTQGQKDRMRFILQGVRSSLLDCLGCQEPCQTAISTKIIPPSNPLSVCDSLIFTHQSVNVKNYEWRVDGNKFSTSERLTLYHTQQGRHEIILIGTDSTGTCQERDTFNYTVGCAFTISFNSPIPPCFSALKPINLSISNVNGAKTSWYIDGVFESNGASISKILNAGVYEISVTVDDGKCTQNKKVLVLVGCKEICNNGFDDDNDGLYDCFDPDCCSQCKEFYFQACSQDYKDCYSPQPFSIREKWASDNDQYNILFSSVCGDITGDGKTEILTLLNDSIFAFIDGNGQTVRKLTVPNRIKVDFQIPVVIADVDYDGKGEIFFSSSNNLFQNSLVCLREDGTLVYKTNTIQSPTGSIGFTPIHLVDFNLDGKAEVVIGFNIYDANTGQLLSTFPNSIQTPQPLGHIVVCDILPDNACTNCRGLEIVSGGEVVSISDDFMIFNVEQTINTGRAGMASVVDWDLDGDLDVVGTFPNSFTHPIAKIVIWDGQTNSIIQGVDIPGISLGSSVTQSAPVVSNMDADPEPELVINFTSEWQIRRFDNNLSQTWTTPVIQPTAITPICFDFHLDGVNEVIIRDASALKIIDGQTGVLIDTLTCYSITNDERLLLADIDSDGHAEMVTSCSKIKNAVSGGIFAFEGSSVEWPNTRPVVYSYSNFQSGINDDLTIPNFAQQHHLPPSIQDFNSSFTQLIIPAEPDTLEYSINIDSINCDGIGFWITLNICSSGMHSLDSLDLSIYNGDPNVTGTERLLTQRLDIIRLKNQECMTIQQWLPKSPNISYERLCLIVNDPGTRLLPFDYTDGIGYGGPGECDYLNNIDCIRLPRYKLTPPDIPDTIICNQTELIITAPANLEYLWSDGTINQQYRVSQSGIHWLEIKDHCGNKGRDSFKIDFFTSPRLLLPDTIKLCKTGVHPISAGTQFSSYKWQDGSTDNKYTVFQEGTCWVEVTDTCGNIQTDSTIVLITPLPDLGLPDTLNICTGDSIRLQVSPYKQHAWLPNTEITCTNCASVEIFPSTSKYYYAHVVNESGCTTADSVYIIVDSLVPKFDTIFICPGDSIYYHGDSLGIGNHQILINNPASCDTFVTLDILSFDEQKIKKEESICVGDSLLFNGSYFRTGSYSVRIAGVSCDTVYDLIINEFPRLEFSISTTPSCPKDDSGMAVFHTKNGEQVKLTWSSGIEINDSTVGGLQPGTYKVTAIDSMNCFWESSFEIKSTPIPDYNISIQGDSCKESDGFEINIEGGAVGQLQGDNYFQNGKKFTALRDGRYNLALTDSNGCYIKDTILILSSFPRYNFNITDSVRFKLEETIKVNINGNIDHVTKYIWAPNIGLLCDTCPYLLAQPTNTTTYQVTIIDDHGCEHFLNIKVILDDDIQVYIPNVFSPNGDNLNDNFKIFSSRKDVFINSFEIYNRWGELVHREENKFISQLEGWGGTFNGSELNPDVFVYKIGYLVNDRKSTISGSVTLLR